jgi:hypothetical protein
MTPGRQQASVAISLRQDRVADAGEAFRRWLAPRINQRVLLALRQSRNKLAHHLAVGDGSEVIRVADKADVDQPGIGHCPFRR